MTTQPYPTTFWCLTCKQWTRAEWDEFDPEFTSPPVPYCRHCGESYQCGECGFEIDLTGTCQRFNSTGDDSCAGHVSTTTKGI